MLFAETKKEISNAGKCVEITRLTQNNFIIILMDSRVGYISTFLLICEKDLKNNIQNYFEERI